MKTYAYQAVLFLALSGAIVLPGCNQTAVGRKAPRVIEGVLDLRGWNFEVDGSVDLSGDFEFYWEQFLQQEDFSSDRLPQSNSYVTVPSSWNSFVVDGEAVGGQGFATYRVRIRLTEWHQELALKFLDMGTAFSVFANGRQLLAVGSVGKNAGESIPRYLPRIVHVNPSESEIDLIFHVSNFHHKRGGAWEKITLGLEEELRADRQLKVSIDFFLFGCFFIISLYHAGLFGLARKHKPSLYFSIFCFLIAYRTIATGERLLFDFLQAAPWELLVKIEYLSAFAAVPVFGIYLQSHFSQDFNRHMLRFIQVCGLAFIVIILFTPVRIYSHTPPLFQIFTLICLAYGFYLLTKCVSRKREGAAIVLAAFVILCMATINDILDVNEVIRTGHWVPFSIFVFVLLQAYLIAAHFSRSFTTVETQHERLTIVNEQYSIELAERKRAEKEKKKLEEKLMRAEKMETVGLLAGGIAHDLNNILSAIVGYPDLLLMNMKEDNPLVGPLKAMKASGIRAANIVQDLLTLARRGVVNLSVVNINRIIADHLASPEHQEMALAHANIEIRCDLDDKLLNIQGSLTHIQKTIMNLLLNAVEAQPDGGSVSISTENRYVDIPVHGYDRVKEGDYVVLRVQDTGPGIDIQDQQKIFEPFYTKKVMGRSGTGLGMSVVWGTMQDHEGYIDIISGKKIGTTFELYFPATREILPLQKQSLPPGEYMGNGEKILVVDDVEEQRILASDMLTRLGYQVDAASSGEQAVEYLKTQSCDLLVLDMIMDPGIDGYETYRQIVEQHGRMKAVIASGYAETERVRSAQNLGAGSYIRKPYTLEKIGVAVKSELEGGSSAEHWS